MWRDSAGRCSGHDARRSPKPATPRALQCRAPAGFMAFNARAECGRRRAAPVRPGNRRACCRRRVRCGPGFMKARLRVAASRQKARARAQRARSPLAVIGAARTAGMGRLVGGKPHFPERKSLLCSSRAPKSAGLQLKPAEAAAAGNPASSRGASKRPFLQVERLSFARSTYSHIYEYSTANHYI